jgi:hypothetical protein
MEREPFAGQKVGVGREGWGRDRRSGSGEKVGVGVGGDQSTDLIDTHTQKKNHLARDGGSGLPTPRLDDPSPGAVGPTPTPTPSARSRVMAAAGLVCGAGALRRAERSNSRQVTTGSH